MPTSHSYSVSLASHERSQDLCFAPSIFDGPLTPAEYKQGRMQGVGNPCPLGKGVGCWHKFPTHPTGLSGIHCHEARGVMNIVSWLMGRPQAGSKSKQWQCACPAKPLALGSCRRRDMTRCTVHSDSSREKLQIKCSLSGFHRREQEPKSWELLPSTLFLTARPIYKAHHP